MNIIGLAISALAVLLITTVHEFTRALVSTLLGDKRPKEGGRLTINPVKHFEPIGFILVLATGGFGWGKPVETSALYYKSRKRDTLLTAILPSIVNLLLGLVAAFICSSAVFTRNVYMDVFFYNLFQYSIAFFVYNLVPVSPMDGAKVMSVLMPANEYFKYLQYEKMIQMLFLVCLFLGWTDFIIMPVMDAVTTLFKFLAGF